MSTTSIQDENHSIFLTPEPDKGSAFTVENSAEFHRLF